MSQQISYETMMRVLLTPCKTRDELKAWIRVFLDIDLPDSVVCEESNASLMELVWEVYEAATNGDTEKTSFLFYSARGAGKTLGAAILHVLMMVHHRRAGIHLAAIRDQSQKCFEYVEGFFRRQYLCDLIDPDEPNNKSQVTLKLTDAANQKVSIRIVVATMSSTNGQHTPWMCVDGSTRILVRNSDSSIRKNRRRVTATAKGIFQRLAGMNTGGRPGGEYELDIPIPSERIEALTFNTTTGCLEYKPILRGHRHKKAALQLKTEDGKEIICTPDHPLYVLGRGFTEAGEIAIGETIVSLGKGKGTRLARIDATAERLPIEADGYDEWEQVVLGSVLGDGTVTKREWTNPFLIENHSPTQQDYMEWKRSLIGNKVKTYSTNPISGYTGEPLVGFRTSCSPLFAPYLATRDTFAGIERLGPLGLAVWYMDDGCKGNGFRLSTECWSEEQNRFLADFLWRKFQIKVDVRRDTKEDGRIYYYLGGGIEAKRRLVEICEPHIHPQIAYKFDLSANVRECAKCGARFWFYERGTGATTCSSLLCRLQGKTLGASKLVSKTEIGERWVYDFTVADNHNFFGNGLLNKNCVDECDIIRDVKAYDEAKKIPVSTPAPEKKPPITLYVSTRKSTYGLVQQELDLAQKRNHQVRHCNIIDVTQPCPPSKHGASKRLWLNPKDYVVLDDVGLSGLMEKQRINFIPMEAYEGCVTRCKLAPMCRGRLARSQRNTSTFLKSHGEVTSLFQQSNLDSVISQLMCEKPSSEGLVFTDYDPQIHVLTWNQMWARLTGEEPKREISKHELVAEFKRRRVYCYLGIDWGWMSPSTAMVVYITPNQDVYVVEELSTTLTNDPEFIELIKKHLVPLHDIQMVYPDTANGSAVNLLKKAGMPVTDKHGKETIHLGIQTMKAWIRVPGTYQTKFFVASEGCEGFKDEMSRYHLKMDASGSVLADDEYADEFNHRIDAVRYVFVGQLSRFLTQIAFAAPPKERDTEPTIVNGMAVKIPSAIDLAQHLGVPLNDNRDALKQSRDEESGGGNASGFSWSF